MVLDDDVRLYQPQEMHYIFLYAYTTMSPLRFGEFLLLIRLLFYYNSKITLDELAKSEQMQKFMQTQYDEFAGVQQVSVEVVDQEQQQQDTQANTTELPDELFGNQDNEFRKDDSTQYDEFAGVQQVSVEVVDQEQQQQESKAYTKDVSQ